ncbi:SGNH/GDSL hydrolase family protein [Kitasatospora sp. NPDC048239]|uniref:SGNH/GDSL hydrolase family protein n=1 Tax=Kitasatospora sp. NPDC048239 TaxID=3364046 RepID=UPI00371EA773
MLRPARKLRTTRKPRTAGRSALLGAVALGAALALTSTSAQAATPAPRHYVALGDSYAAGAGVPGQSAGLCLRSDRNYGHLVAAALKAGAYTDVTCAAAKVKAMTQPQYDAFIRVNDPQLDAVTADTDLVTLGIGGNDLGATDLGLGELVGTCIAGAVVNPLGTPCKDVFHHGYWDWSSWSWQYGNDDLADRIAAARPQIADTLKRIHAKAPNARVLLVGYPSVLPARGSDCFLRQPVTAGDVEYMHGVLDQLNAMLKSTAAAGGATYVDTATPTAGHDVCSNDRWIEGALPGSPAVPFHPNATGEKVMADAVLAALR